MFPDPLDPGAEPDVPPPEPPDPAEPVFEFFPPPPPAEVIDENIELLPFTPEGELGAG